jgi:limonene-1,2-epoxide hydrolase
MFVSDGEDVKRLRMTGEPGHTWSVAPRTLLVTAVIAIALAGCGGGSSDHRGSSGPVAGDADPADVRVIDAWVTALRHGQVRAAAGYFAIPSVAENGPVLVRIRSPEDARRFNRSLPCGARLVRAETAGQFTTATFRLTERPGAGICGAGAGEVAKTAFVIRDGKIAEWRRVGAGAGGRPAPSQSA